MPDWERKYMGRWKMPNNDYILRSDALKAVCETCSEHGENGEPCAGHCGDYALIQNIPSADVEPVVHGLWIEYKHEGQMAQYCSECGSDPGVIYIYERCPECGAHMNAKRGREDNDD